MGFGIHLIWRETRHYQTKARNMKALPVGGFKKALVEHGQGGDIYRHLRFHIGCKLLPLAGFMISYAAELLDKRQLKQGREESKVELLDNQAARDCGVVLIDRIKRNYEDHITHEKLRMILHS